MKKKKASKHLSSKSIKQIFAYTANNKYLRLIIQIYHTTAIRLSEIEDYIKAADVQKPYIEIKPKKHNNMRLLPNIFYGMSGLQFEDYMKNITWTKGAIEKQISKLKKDSGIDFSSHDFRATFITNALEKEIPVQKLIALTGHKDMNTLMQYYRINTEHSMYLFAYINQPFEEWTDIDDVLVLKQQLRLQSKQIGQISFKCKKQSEMIEHLQDQLIWETNKVGNKHKKHKYENN